VGRLRQRRLQRPGRKARHRRGILTGRPPTSPGRAYRGGPGPILPLYRAPHPQTPALSYTELRRREKDVTVRSPIAPPMESINIGNPTSACGRGRSPGTREATGALNLG
jgi:hypothetical protein